MIPDLCSTPATSRPAAGAGPARRTLVAALRGLAVPLALLVLPLAAGSAAAAEADGPARLCQEYAGLPGGDGPHAGMAWVPGGTFTMGDDDQRPEERPAQRATVDGFWIDRTEVTNAQFARFVAATGYRTVAERGLSAEEWPDLPPELRAPGAVVFTPPAGLRDLVDVGQWWQFVPGADWRHPQGPGSSIEGKDDLPVVDVAYEDAVAYARWAGRALPSEAQWEFAARGGLDGATYAWGDAYDPGDGWRANTWQGLFPVRDAGDDGFKGAAPVGCFAPNPYGLFDMIGNVWELTADRYAPGHAASSPGAPGDGPPAVVIKGGSYLCAPNFCARYRPAARQPQELGLGTSHLGFRTVAPGPGPSS